MLLFHALAALFALWILARHLPRLRGLLGGGGGPAARLGAATSLLTVAVAALVLAMAVKALWLSLMDRPGGAP